LISTEVSPRTRTKRDQYGPDQIRFYPPEWQFILEKAKLGHRLHVATDCAIEEKEADLPGPYILIMQGIADYKAEKPNREIPEGKLLTNFEL
jgi:hypothetical protein